MAAQKGAPATTTLPPVPLAQTVLRTLLYLRHGEGDVFAVAQSITALLETHMNSEQELDQAIADLKQAHADARREAVDAFARIEAKLAEAVAKMADLGDEKADLVAMVQEARDEAADYAGRHPAAAPPPAPAPPPAG